MKPVISGSNQLLLSVCFAAWITTFTSPAESFSASFSPSTRDAQRNSLAHLSQHQNHPRELSSRLVLHVSKLRDDEVSTVGDNDDEHEGEDEA